MNVNCNICGTTFDHCRTGIDWHNQLFLCFGCNDQGYDITRKGQITLHGKPYRTYDSAVAGHSAPRTTDRGTLQARELGIIQAGTDAMNKGMSSPLNWGLVIAGLCLMPFTGGLSFGVTLIGGWRMGPPKHAIQAAIPRTVDTVAPKAGCIRVLCAIGGLLFMAFAFGLFALLVAYQAGLLGVR